MQQHRNHSNYWAFLAHRISGLVLAIFLPVHMFVLGMAIEDAARFDGFIDWTENPLVKLAETGLIILLAVHLTGGLRVLALEFLPWHNWQKSVIAITGGISLAIGLIFMLNAS